MSEGGAVGQVEREALDRVRERLVRLRREQYRLLEDIADLQRLGVAQQTGDRFTERLLQDLGRLNRRDADRMVDETADLVPQLSLSGEPLPPRLPSTATVFVDKVHAVVDLPAFLGLFASQVKAAIEKEAPKLLK